MTEKSCKCVQLKQFNDLFYIADTDDLRKDFFEIEFQPTAVNESNSKTFTIINSCQVPCNFFIKRDTRMQYMYRAFTITEENNASVLPRHSWEIKIVFSPKLPNQEYCENIQIYPTAMQHFRLSVKGSSLAPHIISSMNCLMFNISLKAQNEKRVFELKNNSSVTAFYQFDINERGNGLYKIRNIKGSLRPKQHAYVDIIFKPKKPGVHCRDLVCLIFNQRPLVFHLVGLYFPNDVIDENKFVVIQHEASGYEYYFRDNSEMNSAVTFDTLHFDFEKIEIISQNNEHNCGRRTLSCRNCLEKDVLLEWETDSDKQFVIIPPKIILKKEETTSFECKFFPTYSDTVYSKIIKGFLYNNELIEQEKLQIYVPICFNLRMIGNTFIGTCSWLPRIEMQPKVITLAPVVPGEITYGSFILKSFGHLPVLFKFVAPKESNVIIKPLVGTFTDYQIFAVKLHADKDIERCYFEYWKVIFNNRKESFYQFSVQCCSQFPRLIVGHDDVIRFGTIYAECESSVTEPLFNPTVLTIQYAFLLHEHSGIKMNTISGRIGPNQLAFVNWRLKVDVTTPQQIPVRYEMHVLRDLKVVSGKPTVGTVTLYSKSEYSTLCAFPKRHDFEEVFYGQVCETEFDLHNLAEPIVYFTLLCKEKRPEFKVSICPKMGTLQPKTSSRISIKITANQSGKHNFQFYYKIRESENSKRFINDETFRIFSIDLNCVYATIQVVNLVGSNFGPLFSKVVLWKLLRIDDLNEIFRTIEAKETRTIEANLPDYEVNDNIFQCTLIVRNVSRSNCKFSVKAIKLCGCPPRTVSDGLSRRKVVNDCPHSEMAKIWTTVKDVISVNSIASVQIKMRYLIPGTCRFLVRILLGDQRTIQINFGVKCLTNLTLVPSSYYPHFSMTLNPTYIGLNDTEIQEYRLYNNTSNIVKYELDTSPLIDVNFDYQSLILDCINPNAVIPPYSSASIFIKFKPIEHKLYTISTDLLLGNETVTFTVCGQGTNNLEPIGTESLHTEQFSLENAIELSTDHITVERLDLWSEELRLIFIKNLTDDKIIGYSFEYKCIPGLIFIQPEYKKGTLQPKEVQAVVFQIKSYDKPCNVLVQMACTILDHTQYVAYKTAEQLKKLEKERHKDDFTITEKGIEYPVSDDRIDLPCPMVSYTSLAMCINVSHTRDRDLLIPVSQQYKLSPPMYLQLNSVEIIDNYCKTIQSHFHETLIDFDSTTDQNTKRMILLKKNEMELIKNVAECLIADAVFNDMFANIVEEQSHCDSPFYYQFKMNDEIMPKEYRTTKADFQCRKELIEKYLNRPPSSVVHDVFKNLIFESMHEVYEMGPPPFKRSNKQYVTDLRQKFAPPSCKCPKFGDHYDPKYLYGPMK